MGRGFRIGRLFGIDLRVDYSWIFIFLLLSWNLTAVFTQTHPAWSAGLSFMVAAIAALCFFASVLVHELAHAVVALAFGIPVRNITLFLFGGVSNIEREPPSPMSEFLMAIVGPVASIAIGGVVLAIATLLTQMRATDVSEGLALVARLSPLETLLLWLGPINIMVGLFNLIPGFPLDGGRVLRSILWGTTHDLHKATRWAAWVGQATGWLFIVTGIAMAFGARVPFFGSGFVSGLWLAFIGWFLNSAAASSYSRMVVQELLEEVTVSRLMRRQWYSIPSDASIATAVAEWFMRSDERAFPVVHDEGMVGLLCLADIRRVPQSEWATTSVTSVMTPRERLLYASPRETVATALSRLSQVDVSQLPVFEVDGRLVGILERRDVARWIELRLGGGQGMPLRGSSI
jgi:Zn-dependent protease/CBS domain-containing protein